MNIRIQCLCIDTTDPAKIAPFWEAALGWRRTFEEDDEIVLEPPEGSPEEGVVPDLLFLRVPEGNKTVSRTDVALARPDAEPPSPGRPAVINASDDDIANRQIMRYKDDHYGM